MKPIYLMALGNALNEGISVYETLDDAIQDIINATPIERPFEDEVRPVRDINWVGDTYTVKISYSGRRWAEYKIIKRFI